MAPGAWTNWPGNVSADPAEIVHPRDEAEVSEIVAAAAARGQGVRVVGAGHSFMPLCATDGILLCLDRMAGLVRADRERCRAVVRPGSSIGSLGDPLWDGGLCLHNQGDIDTQHIAGAISTSTHGSGTGLQSFSGTARGFRVVQPDGSVAVVGEDQPDLLAGLQTSLGMLGVITQVELDVRPAFTLREQIDFWPLAEILERWDVEMASRRHFSFFWLPYSDSAETLFLESTGGMDLADHGFVKRYDERDAGCRAAVEHRTCRRGRSAGGLTVRTGSTRTRLFEGEIVQRELEYMVPYRARQGRVPGAQVADPAPQAPEQLPGRDPLDRGRPGDALAVLPAGLDLGVDLRSSRRRLPRVPDRGPRRARAVPAEAALGQAALLRPGRR